MDESHRHGWHRFRLLGGALVFLILLIAPLPFPTERHRLIAVLMLAFLYGVTEALLLAVTLCVLLGLQGRV